MNTQEKTKIFIAGHKGMVGSAIKRLLQKQKNIDTIIAERDVLDLRNPIEVEKFFSDHHFDHVYLAAAKVGGILANTTTPADFLHDNLMIQMNVINSCLKHKIKQLLFIGSSCIYPKLCEQPMMEEYLLTGSLEPTNEPYALAKIIGIKYLEALTNQYGDDFFDSRIIMPSNLYGEGDNYDPRNSHVIPALIVKFHAAKIRNLPFVEIWGSGNALREFLNVNDLAEAAFHVMNLEKNEYKMATTKTSNFLNVGSGKEITIKELSHSIKQVTNYQGKIVFDENQLEGTPRKLLDSTKIHNTGWSANISLQQGLERTYKIYRDSLK
jgi:GDP-L-fucose synthase